MIKFFDSFLISIFIIFVFSCGTDEQNEPKNVPSEWVGHEGDFKRDFFTRIDGNETLLLHRQTEIPFAGRVERNGTKFMTTQTFEGGKLNGVSIKKSNDGSWVEANYKNGKLHGHMIFYGKNGKKRSVLSYKNGQLKK